MTKVENRKKTRQVSVGNILIGGDAPISIQSMTNAPSSDVTGTLKQIHACKEAGCDIIRCAIPSLKDIDAFAEITKNSPLPVVADIHFDWRIAVKAITAGAAKIRINPGNMENWEEIKEILTTANDAGIPIRIGVNGGSIKHKNSDDTRSIEDSLVEEALTYAKRFEEYGFSNIVLSLKMSDALGTVRVNRAVSQLCNYPLHIGVTEAGVEEDAIIKSALAIGALLADGIGDTMRLSFTGEPVNEVNAAVRILKAAGLRKAGVDLISCPTCGRCQAENMPELAMTVRNKLASIKKPLRIAVMGCEVNGPGEASEADAGIACSASGFLIFKEGKVVAKHPTKEAALANLLEIVNLLENQLQ